MFGGACEWGPKRDYVEIYAALQFDKPASAGRENAEVYFLIDNGELPDGVPGECEKHGGVPGAEHHRPLLSDHEGKAADSF